MTQETALKLRWLLTFALLVGIAIALAVSQATVIGQDQAPDRSLAGVWLVKITPRNCATGEFIPAAAFEALFTFHEDKTMSVLR